LYLHARGQCAAAYWNKLDENGVDHLVTSMIRLFLLVPAALLASPSFALAQSKTSPMKGLVVERIEASARPTAKVGDRIITVVRVDPEHFAFRFLSESHEGKRRPLPDWVRDQGLLGGINAGMFLPDGRSCGFLRQRGVVRSNRSPSKFTGVIGFDPSGALPPFAVGGNVCRRRLPWFKGHYQSVLQGYRVMVDCRGRPMEWPHKRRFSMAAIGVDVDGNVVLVHVRTPYRPTVLNRMLSEDSLGIRGLIYMEGGPEASLFVKAGSETVREIGSWEDGFNPNDDNHIFWDLPNVIGFSLREKSLPSP